jgi:D-alanine-D-alanine ligase-like ATP-grasp enzyme
MSGGGSVVNIAGTDPPPPGGGAKRIAVLKGGGSLERTVSLRSGARAQGALKQLGHETVAIDAGPELVTQLLAARPDAAFLALHGRDGEDGTIQSLLEAIGIPYTGSGPSACMRCTDKALAKHLMREAGIPTPDFHAFKESAIKELGVAVALASIERALGFPMVVKPASQGSALGVKFAHSSAELPAAIVGALSYDRKVLLERYVKGRDLAVSVLDSAQAPHSGHAPRSGPPAAARTQTPAGEQTQPQTPAGEQRQQQTPAGGQTQPQTPAGEQRQPQTPAGEQRQQQTPAGGQTQPHAPAPVALPVVEAIPREEEFYNYESRYEIGMTTFVCPAELPAQTTARAQELAVKVYGLLGCHGVARVDLMLDENNGELTVLETNVGPGLTETSLLPLAADAAGIDFDTLVGRILESAFTR